MKSYSNLTDKNFWSGYWDNNLTIEQLSENLIKSDQHPLKQWIKKYIASTDSQECIELGCYPGGFLTIFGELGYVLNGVDILDEVESVLPSNLKKLGFKIDNFLCADVNSLKLDHKYQVVSSFGLIEHFKHWEEVFKKHLDLVEDEGYLVIEVPNFRGWPHYLIRLFYDYQNFKVHNISAMKLKNWKSILIENNFEILYLGGVGRFGYGLQNKKFNLFQRFSYPVTSFIINLIRNKFSKDHPQYSPYLGVIARKKK